MTEQWEWDETLYAGAASHYLRGRMPYPPELGERIVAASGVGSGACTLDVGCGPGSLTLLLAQHVAQIVGVDADRQMIIQADGAARRRGLWNVAWRQMRAEQLPADLGSFDLVTFAQSFHWMERERVAKIVRGMLRDGGSCVHIRATTHRGDYGDDVLPRPRPPYEQIEALVASYLGPVRRAGRGRLPTGIPSGVGGDESDVYREAGFEGPASFTVERGELVDRSVDEIVAATFSLSSSTPHLFGPRRDEFEVELRALLQAASDGGRFCEQVRDIAFDVWRPR